MEKCERKKTKSKDRKCIYCGDKHHSKGFCHKHYNCLKHKKQDLDNKEQCLEYLKNSYTKNRKCLYCGGKYYGRGFCEKHYSYLRSHKQDLDNKEQCLEYLRNDYVPRGILNKCVYCGE